VPRWGALSLLQKTLHYRAGGGGGEELVLDPSVVGQKIGARPF
jgi:hypothetical protein